MQNCEDIQIELSAYLDGEAPPSERAAIEAHVRDCPACRALLDELSQAQGALASLPKLKAPATLAAAIRQETSKQESRPAIPQVVSFEPKRATQSWRPALMGIAAMLMAGVLIFQLLPMLASHDHSKTAMTEESRVATQPAAPAKSRPPTLEAAKEAEAPQGSTNAPQADLPSRKLEANSPSPSPAPVAPVVPDSAARKPALPAAPTTPEGAVKKLEQAKPIFRDQVAAPKGDRNEASNAVEVDAVKDRKFDPADSLAHAKMLLDEKRRVDHLQEQRNDKNSTPPGQHLEQDLAPRVSRPLADGGEEVTESKKAENEKSEEKTVGAVSQNEEPLTKTQVDPGKGGGLGSGAGAERNDRMPASGEKLGGGQAQKSDLAKSKAADMDSKFADSKPAVRAATLPPAGAASGAPATAVPAAPRDPETTGPTQTPAPHNGPGAAPAAPPAKTQPRESGLNNEPLREESKRDRIKDGESAQDKPAASGMARDERDDDKLQIRAKVGAGTVRKIVCRKEEVAGLVDQLQKLAAQSGGKMVGGRLAAPADSAQTSKDSQNGTKAPVRSQSAAKSAVAKKSSDDTTITRATTADEANSNEQLAAQPALDDAAGEQARSFTFTLSVSDRQSQALLARISAMESKLRPDGRFRNEGKFGKEESPGATRGSSNGGAGNGTTEDGFAAPNSVPDIDETKELDKSAANKQSDKQNANSLAAGDQVTITIIIETLP